MKSEVKYEVYLSGSKNPVWSYVTDRHFYSRLNRVVQLRSISKVNVRVTTTGKWYEVLFNVDGVPWKSSELKSSPI